MTARSFALFFKVDVALGAAALAPVPEVGFVLQLAGVGAAIGSVVALRARGRDAEVDTWRVTTAWASLGLFVGLLVVTVAAVA
jgi:hypothetical protein